MATEPDTKKDDDAGAGKKPVADDPPPAVSFRTKAEFEAEMGRRVKADAAKESDRTQEAIFAKLGITAPEELEELAKTVQGAKQTVTDADKLRNENAKLAKARDAAAEQIKNLTGWKHTALKRKAIDAYAAKVSDLELLALALDQQIVINDDDTVTGPHGKALDDVVEDLLKKKPVLKAADYKPGGDTKAADRQAAADDAGAGKRNADPKTTASGNGQPLTIADAVIAELQAAKTRRQTV